MRMCAFVFIRVCACVCVCLCMSDCLHVKRGFPIREGMGETLTDRQTPDRLGNRGKDSGAERERDKRGWSYCGRGGATQLSLNDGNHGERAVLNSGTSNGRRRCLCHHGDGAVPREVVMGWQVRDNRSSLQACTPKARVATCRPTAKPEKSKFYLWGRKPRLWGKFMSGRGQSHTELR